MPGSVTFERLRTVSRATGGEFVTLLILKLNEDVLVYSKTVSPRALDVCIQGRNYEGFLDAFFTLVAFPTFRFFISQTK